VNDFWRRVGGPDSITWVTFVITYPVMLVTTFIGSPDKLPGHELEFFLVSTGAHVALVVFLLTAKVTVLRSARLSPLPVRTMVVFAFALLVRAWFFDSGLLAVGLSDQIRIFPRLLATPGSLGATLVLTAYTVSLARDFSRNSHSLRSTVDRLVATREGAAALIQSRRDAIVEQVREQLTDRLASLTHRSPSEGLQNLRNIIEDVVRPVSHRLSRQVTDLGGASTLVPLAGILWGRVFVNSTKENPIRPGLLALWLASATLMFAPARWGIWQGLVLSAVILVVPYVFLWLVRPLWSPLILRRATATRSLVFTLLLLVTGILTTFVGTVLSGMPEMMNGIFVPGTILSILAGWGIALTVSARAEAASVLAELTRTTEALREDVVRLNTAFRLQQKAISKALHGPVQDATSAATFRLAAALEAGTASPALMVELHDLITATLPALDETTHTVLPFSTFMADLSELWNGVVSIRTTVSEQVSELLASRPISTSTTTELVREACSNAVRHGKAGNIDVRVDLGEGGDTLVIVVDNDGQTVPLTRRATGDGAGGLGTVLLEELTLSWSLAAEDGITRLTAVIPVI
jgi:anti-sigma regulatory factor (Ser/Thr protein kinase)